MTLPPIQEESVPFPRVSACTKCRRPLAPAGVCVHCVNQRGLILAAVLLIGLPVATEVVAGMTSAGLLFEPGVSSQQRADYFYWSLTLPSIVAMAGLTVCAVYAAVNMIRSQQAVKRADPQTDGIKMCPLCSKWTDQAGTCRRCWVRQSAIAGVTCLLLAPYLFVVLIPIVAFSKPPNLAMAFLVAGLFLVFSVILLSYSGLQSAKLKRGGQIAPPNSETPSDRS